MAEPCTSTSHEFDRCSRFTAFRCDMLSYCWAQGARVRGEQDIGRTRSCADDCLVGGGQEKKGRAWVNDWAKTDLDTTKTKCDRLQYRGTPCF